MKGGLARPVLVFIVVLLSIGVNIGENFLDIFNISRNYLLMTLVAIVVAGLMAHRHLLVIILVSGLTLAVNQPEEVLQRYHLDRNVLFATLISIVFAPALFKLLGMSADSSHTPN